MTWTRRIRWRWVVLGGFIWLTLLSSSSLEDGHPGIARVGSSAVLVLLVLALLTALLRILGRSVTPLIRQAAKLRRHRHPPQRPQSKSNASPRQPR